MAVTKTQRSFVKNRGFEAHDDVSPKYRVGCPGRGAGFVFGGAPRKIVVFCSISIGILLSIKL